MNFFNKELSFHFTCNFDPLIFNSSQTIKLNSTLQNLEPTQYR
jgi:hypothetical protein